jgi:photosystem II stability/assembly factor-like uncharacterized protein
MRALKISLLVFILSITISGQWYQQISGTGSNLQSVFFINLNTGWACGSDGVIIKTTNGGQDWFEQISNTTTELRGIQFVDANNGWAFGGNQILSSTDGGSIWTVQNFLSSSYLSALQFINVNLGWVISHSTDTSYIFQTTDGGISWTLQTQTYSGYYEALFFLDENYGWASSIMNVVRTTNGGINWIEHSANIEGSPICIRFADHQTGWISSNTLGSYDISKSTDGGLNWISQISGLGDFIQSISCSDANTVYAAGMQPFVNEGFILNTTDGGTSWFEQYRSNGRLNSILFINDTTGWAVGDSGKILSTENGGVTSVEEDIISPFHFYLSQNYPNPFNPSTKIKFTIPTPPVSSPLVKGRTKEGSVTLKVYDLLGREVATLIKEEKPAGEYEVEFNSVSHSGNVRNLPSGIYFYQLKAGEFSETKKMILLR